MATIPEIIAQMRGQLNGLSHSVRQMRGIAAAVHDLAAKMPDMNMVQMSHLTMELMSIYRSIDAIPGKVVTYNASGALDRFTVADEGLRSNSIAIQISTDGPFIQTSYPLVGWRPTEPTAAPGPRATDFGLLKAVTTQYLPDQQFPTNFIEVTWELTSGGSQRNQQNTRVLPFFSRPDYNNRLPQPYVWRPNDSILFNATFERIVFGGDIPTTAGRLEVTLPGYRIVDQ